jgi:nucleoside-diphosphate-sugar epimerase
MSIEEMAGLIIKMTGSKSQIVFKPLPADDPQVRQPDITRAKTLLGWEPKVPLDKGLTSTIEYFRRKMAEASNDSQSTAGAS